MPPFSPSPVPLFPKVAAAPGMILVALATLCLSVSASALTLVKNGEARATIVLPAETEFDRYANMTEEEIEAFLERRFPNASAEDMAKAREALSKQRKKEMQRVGDEEELAVEELVTFIKKMSGAELPVERVADVDALPKGNLILLGAELAVLEGQTQELDSLGPEGILLKTKGRKLILSGKKARGTLYAAYDFLESQGCRWFMPGPFGEVIPRKDTIKTRINKTENPSHSERYWWCTWGHGDAYPRWTLRNKGDYVKALNEPRVQQSHASQVPLNWGARHTDRAITVTKKVREWKRDEKGRIIRDENGRPKERVWVEREVQQLPDEYYTMSGGTPNTHLANMSNPKAWELCAEYYRDEYFYSRPLEDYVSISCADGLVVDDRKASRKLDSNEYDWTMGAPSATDRLWFFHRRYIDKVLEEHPDRKFGVLVYANNLTPPRLEQVHPAMSLVFAPLGICPLHHVRAEQCKTNRAYHKWFEAWMTQKRAVDAEAVYYDYLPIGFQWCNFILSPQWHIVGKNYPYFHEQGLDGHTSQGFDDWGAMGLTGWVAQRLYWDVNQDYNDLVREYCELRFGNKAAKAMHEYYKIYENRMMEVPDLCSNEIWGNHLAIDAETRSAGRKALAKAERLVEGERHKEQYEAVADFQTAMDAWCGGIDHARETGNFAEAAAMMEPAFDIAHKLNERHYSHYVQPNRIDKTTHTQFRPGGWYNKYLTWQEKIDGSKASLCLPRYMKVALDTDNVAWAKGWQNPDTNVGHLEEWDVTVVPDVKYHTQREVAGFFYRTDVAVPKEFGDAEKVDIYFPSIIARGLRIWINGKPVVFDNGEYEDVIWRGPSYFWKSYDHQQQFEITDLVEPGTTNTIAFRVFKSYDHGGTYDRVFLLADAPAEDE